MSVGPDVCLPETAPGIRVFRGVRPYQKGYAIRRRLLKSFLEMSIAKNPKRINRKVQLFRARLASGEHASAPESD